MGPRSVPPRIIVLVALASYLGLIVAALMGWQLWALVVAAALPWGLLYTLELQWTRHFSWLALFYLHIIRREPTGDERHVATLGPGEFFGEAGLMIGSPRNATVRADGDVEVLRLDRATFSDIIGQSEITERDLVRVVEERRPRSRA